MNNARRLPIGIQDFSKLRKGSFVYVDKTARIHQLITGSGTAFFLSRPRRFGKSLLCSTLEYIFSGNRELFKGSINNPALSIDSLNWEWHEHPVIKLDLNPGVYSNGVHELHVTLNRDMEFCAKRYGVPFTGETVSDKFTRLISSLYEHSGKQAVVIIDEYDKPLLNTIDVPDIHIEMREALKGFYSVLKSADKYLRFVFLTGVTKFSQVSIFSDLNHLVDLTLDPRYADICGITQDELEETFEPEIASILQQTNKSREDYINTLRLYYDGYRFSDKMTKVYNPFGLLNHFDSGGKFLPYWYETGTPTFLIKIMMKKKVKITDLSSMHVKYEDFRKYDIENMEAPPLLYQTGYLTISDYDEDRNRYTLDYPNIEVRSSFAVSLLKQYLKAPEDRSRALINELPDALEDGDVEKAMTAISRYLASIPYDIIKETENYYETVIHLIFRMFGLNCRSEVRIASGRIDTLVETKNFVYCFEFKLNGTAEEALAQIDTKEYLLPWEGTGKTLYKIGVNFDYAKRNIGDYQYAYS